MLLRLVIDGHLQWLDKACRFCYNKKINILGGVGGSRPSLLWFACLLLGSTLFGALAADFSDIVVKVSSNTGGLKMNNISNIFTAVIFATIKPFLIAASAVMAGLAANGVTPHLLLQKRPCGAFVFPINHI